MVDHFFLYLQWSTSDQPLFPYLGQTTGRPRPLVNHWATIGQPLFPYLADRPVKRLFGTSNVYLDFRVESSASVDHRLAVARGYVRHHSTHQSTCSSQHLAMTLLSYYDISLPGYYVTVLLLGTVNCILLRFGFARISLYVIAKLYFHYIIYNLPL